MAKSKSNRKRKSPRPIAANDQMDATPERLAKGDPSDLIESKAEGQSARAVKTRRFASAKLDRLHRNGKISWVQHFAGDWYRTKAEEAKCDASVVGGYGQGVGGGVKFYAFLPRSVGALDAAKQLREARQQWPRDMVGYMDRFLIHDDLPAYGGRAAARSLTQIRNALDLMAAWLRVGT